MRGHVGYRLVAVFAGLALTFPTAGTATADPVTLLSGTVTARFTGQPVPGACVGVFDDQQVQVASGCADNAGNYEVVGELPAGHYRLRSSAEGYADTWYAFVNGIDARDFEAATPVFIWQNERFDLGLRPPGVGVLRGQLTDGGQPVSGAEVTFIDRDANRWGAETRTDETGSYSFSNLWPGHYLLEFSYGNASQFYHQSETITGAQVITVSGSSDTIVDERLIPPGIVEVTVADEVTGQPISEFCAFVPGSDSENQCTTTGLLRFPLTRGTYFSMAINPPSSHFPINTDGFEVRAGETTRIAVTADPAVAIRTTVRDARNGQPVANTCVQPLKVDSPGISVFDDSRSRWCSDDQRAVTIGPLPVTAYRLLVRPGDATYGMQWVGRRGGTGNQEDARRIHATAGTVTTLPDIRLDGAGTISGTVRDQRTGHPVPNVCVFPYATDWAYGDFCTDQQGHYQVTGLAHTSGRWSSPTRLSSSAGDGPAMRPTD